MSRQHSHLSLAILLMLVWRNPDGYDWAGIVFEPIMQVYLEPQHLVNACALMIIVTLFASLIPSWRTARRHSHSAEVMR